ncbi:tyrosine-protein kinase SYK [Capsaspora owczarzaki ATCC 30864]|uniref:tyrosine-protein kinase SYK n=1 Tax=Capsaspora owczarzaki (strain ATCC 30864) TaxID=595528 RepID=UPI0001FE2E77|nr:tyrosine-protein kinase SYK [Capsaspora owczarzaki ATCC 30864]|eukprot:XP_004363395.1 tyrosine-protein kinase SYK [Capsaspora owczarzaki ATCC 30864]
MPNRPPAATGRGNRRPTHLGRSFAALVAALGCLCLCVVHFASVPVDAVYACDFPGPPVVPGVCYCAGTSVSGCQSNLTTLPTFPVETTFLNLAYMQLTQISANAFSGLNQLTILYFNNNQQLLTIAPGAFTGLTALQTLSISNTGLTAIPTTALTSLTLLSTLTIDSNPYITSVESNAFAGLTSLTMLTLTYNQITSIAGFAFSSLTSLMTIALSYNPVSTLAPNAFAGPSSLTRLTFGTNRLTTLPSNAFSGLSALKFLDLSTSQFMTLPFNAFSGLNQLVTLYLRDSPMTTLPPGLFQGLYSLSSVVLAPNNFTFSGSTAPPSTYISASNPATSRSAASSFSAFIATSATARSASSATAASASAASFASASAASLALAIATSVASYASHLVAASASAASTASASAAVLASAISASVASQASSLVAASASAASTASASAGILASAASTASASLASVASVASVATTASASVASTASASAASAEFVRSTSAVVAESAASLSSLSAASVGAATSGLRAASGSGGSVAGVVGGVAGGIVVVALLVALLVLRRRRQRQRHNLESASKTSVPLVPMQSVQLSPASSGVMEEPTYATAKMPHAAAAADPTYAAVGQVGYSTPEYAYAASERIYSSAAPVTRSLRDGILMGAKLGSGAFGVVLRGQLPRNLVPADAQYLLTSPTQQYLDVAVKKMLPDATDKDRKEFIEEVRMVTQFSNPNVVRAIAALLEAEPFMCVLELMPYGDLRAVLQKSQLRNIEWSVGEFAHALAQVASGLDYLQSIRFVHRDIAARNCLVGAGLAVKISDFGLSRSLAAESDYYRMQTKGRLPVKWMAPECLLFRKFTHQSDVWAFGILACK